VLEIGAASGRNFTLYPRTLSDSVAVEPEPYLRERAKEAPGCAPIPVTVLDGTAEALPAADSSFDGVVVCLVLCSVRNQASALAEIHRVLRPGGRLRFYEHVLADAPRLECAQRRRAPDGLPRRPCRRGSPPVLPARMLSRVPEQVQTVVAVRCRDVVLPGYVCEFDAPEVAAAFVDEGAGFL